MIQRRLWELERRILALDLRGVRDSLVRSGQDIRQWAWYADVDHSQDWPARTPQPPNVGSNTYKWVVTGCFNAHLPGIGIGVIQGGFTVASGTTDATGTWTWSGNLNPTDFQAWATDPSGFYPSQQVAHAIGTNNVRLNVATNGFCYLPCGDAKLADSLKLVDRTGTYTGSRGASSAFWIFDSVAGGTDAFGYHYHLRYTYHLSAMGGDSGTYDLTVYQVYDGGSSTALYQTNPSLSDCRSGKLYQEFDFSGFSGASANMPGGTLIKIQEP